MGKRKKQDSEELRQPRLLKLRDAAKYLAMSSSKLRTLIQNGELMVIKTGDNTCPWLLDRLEIDRWIDRAQVRL